jgi:hypothetical protein
MGTLEDHVNHL